MFEQAMVDGVRRNSPWSFAASLTAQSALVGAALVLPVMQVARLETKPPDILFFVPRPVNSIEIVKTVPARGSAATSASILQVGRTYKPFHAPTKIPDHISMGPDLPNAPIYEMATAGGGGLAIGIPGGVPGIGGNETVLPPPPPPKPAPQTVERPARVQIGGSVQAAKLVFGPKPVFPALARQARITGTVRLAALISTDGHIRNLRLMSGHPMLAPAAIEAVSHWVYRPTLLNGLPVEVLTDIEVNFVLQ